MYNAVATLPDGETVQVSGTMLECIEWADRFVMDHPGATININQVVV